MTRNSGLRRGFLLTTSSNNSRKKKKKTVKKNEAVKDVGHGEGRKRVVTTTSSALLDLEDQTPPLSFLSQPSSPPPPPPPPGINHSIQIIDSTDNAPSDRTAVQIPEENHDDRIGLRVVSSRSRTRTHQLSAREPSQPMIQPVGAQLKHKIEPVRIIDNSHENWGGLTNTLDDEQSSPIVVDYTSLSQSLDLVLWKLQRSPKVGETQDTGTVCKTFVADHVTSQPAEEFVWDSLLPSVVDDSNHRSVAMQQLGSEIVSARGARVCCSFLVFGEEKRSRILALGAATVLLHLLEHDNPSKDTLYDLMAVSFPKLVGIVLRSPAKRTVLADQSMRTAFAIISVISQYPALQEDSPLLLKIWEQMSAIDQLLEIRQRWVIMTKPSKKPSPGTQAMAAVLSDWRDVMKSVDRNLQQLLEAGTAPDKARSNSATLLCWNIAGVDLKGVCNVAVGSVWHTLVQEQTRTSSSDLVVFLEAGVQLLQTTRALSPKEDVQRIAESYKDLRAVLRGSLVVLSQSKAIRKLLQGAGDKRSTAFGEDYQKVEASLISLLQCRDKGCIDLTIAALDNLWWYGTSSSGVVDAPDSQGTVSDGFIALVMELKKIDLSEKGELDPSSKAIVMLIARCIMNQGRSYFQYLLEQSSMEGPTIAVLLAIMSGPHEIDSSHYSHNHLAEMKEKIPDLLLARVASSSMLRHKMKESPHLFATLPLNSTVPKLLDCIVVGINAKGNSGKNDVAMAASVALLGVMDACVPAQLDDLARLILCELTKLEAEDAKQDLVSKTCHHFAGKWKRSLLESTGTTDTKYGEVMAAVGMLMIKNSSKTSPLVLLGSLLPGHEPSEQAQRARTRLKYSVQKVLEICNVELSNVDQRRSDGNVFTRLAPLLLLRRMPSFMFQSMWKEEEEVEIRAQPLLNTLCYELSLRLGIDQGSDTTLMFPEERRLAAEIAGHALPFYSSHLPSLFRNICVPAFSRLVASLGDSGTPRHPYYRQAKAALYATCHHLAIADGASKGTGILGMAACALWTLSQHPENKDSDELIELQSGCIEFFSVCLESSMIQCGRPSQNNVQQNRPLVQELEPNQRLQFDDQSSEWNHQRALSMIRKSLCQVLESSKWEFDWVRHGLKHLGTDWEVCVTAPTPMLICVWNAFLLVSQRCPTADHRLHDWASATVPWIMDWGLAQGEDYHPLCMSAALQIVFVLITRTKGFECLRHHSYDSSDVKRAYRWSLRCIKSQEGTTDTVSKMRLAALKLLLAIVSIDQIRNDGNTTGHLEPGELREAFSTVAAAANIDTDRDVHVLAGKVIGALSVAS